MKRLVETLAALAIVLTVVFLAFLFRSPNPAPAPTPTPTVVAHHKVMVIVEENHSEADVMSGMPYLTGLASKYGHASDYTAITHPSLPNYIAIGAGSTLGVADDADPASHRLTSSSVFDQTIAAGKTAKVYAEGMTSNCEAVNDGGYAVRHNEWPYFSSPASSKNCGTYDVPMGSTTSGHLLTDITAGQLPVTGQMTPNTCNDAHDCSLSVADNWLSQWLPVLMNGPDYKAGNLTIIATFDEAFSNGNNVAFVVIDPRLHATIVHGLYNHYSLTKWLDDNAHVADLNQAASAGDLRAAFGLG